MRTRAVLGALKALRTFSALGALGAFSTLGLLSCDDDIVAPERGSLVVTIAGLPAGTPASVTVSGPGGFSRALTATTTLDDLLPGNYGITATNVDQGDSRWAPTPVDQSVIIPAGAGTTSATVTYAVATARLAVNITGLPVGVNANVTVSGPGYNNILTSSTAINLLTPGAYTITAASVVSGGVTYTPTPPTQTIQLPASTTQVAASVVYSVGTGSLTVTINGLGAGVNGAVQVTGPGGYSQQVTATQTLGPLAPGTYTITASTVASNLTTNTPAPATQTVAVTAGATATGTVTYAASALVLGAQQQWGAPNLGDVVYLASPPNDPRIFVVDQEGRIFVIKNGAALATPFLDIRSIVTYGGEQGLLSVAFDPAYATNGRFYVYYNDLNGDIAVARYTATTPGADVANASSRTTVISIPHPVQSNHNGGLAMFGPDGMLYLGTGDGGSGGDPPNNAQNVDVLLGKLLRIDVTNLPYTIPAGNPYAGATAGRDEIWARGLRNPWRYAFDPAGSTLYIADVGQDNWEEVNAVAAATAGVNYGWRIMEGTHCYNAAVCNAAGLTQPVLEYATHVNGTCSVTGGFVYRGAAIPELTGHYLYADYCAGILRSFRLSGGQAVDQRTWSIGAVGNPKSFGLDSAGEMYILSSTGRVYRIVKQ